MGYKKINDFLIILAVITFILIGIMKSNPEFVASIHHADKTTATALPK